MNPHLCGHFICDRGGKNTQRGKTDYSINGVGKTLQLHAKESNWIIFSHHTKNKPQMD